MARVILHIRGKKNEWGVAADMNQSQIDAMREDGIEIGVLENSMPAWIADAGLARPWCFFQDIWNFKNPFNGW